MANGRNPGRADEGMLRRVAIVLSSLPANVASELLGSMSPRSKEAVRRTMTSLDDIDPLERRRAFRAFKVSMEKQPRQASNSSSDPGSASRVVRSRVQTPTGANADGPNASPNAGATNADGANRYGQPTDHSDFAVHAHGDGQAGPDSSASTNHPTDAATAQLAFLQNVDDNDLMRMLRGEHPQTIAVVMASIPPETAGRILPRLDARTQAETLRRIGRIDSFPADAITEIAEHFQQRVNEQLEQGSDAPGKSALHAILSAMPSHARPIVAHATSSTPGLDRASATGIHRQTMVAPESDTPQSNRASQAADFPSAQEPSQDLAMKLRIAEQTASELEDPSTPTGKGGNRRGQQSTGQGSSILDSTDAIAKHLEQLSPAELCQSLGKVETRVAVLALCGLPSATANAALALLPKSAAKQVRQAMGSLQTLNLRDIDDAKEAIAKASVATGHRVPVAA